MADEKNNKNSQENEEKKDAQDSQDQDSQTSQGSPEEIQENTTAKDDEKSLEIGEENESGEDPFNKLNKKKVTKPKPMGKGDGSGTVSGKVKQGRKISPRMFLLGCGAFFLVFLILAALGLYYIANSSEFLQGIGLEIEDVKNILLIFAALFFGIIFFIGFYIFVLNIYRLVTAKKKSKVRYILGLVGGVFTILITIVAGTLSIRQIQSLGGAQAINTDSLLVPRLQTKGDTINVADVNLQAPVPLIAPLKMRFQLNKDQFDRNIAPQIGNRTINGFRMDCGNGQTLQGTQRIYQTGQGGYFNGYCLYLEKGTYQLSLHVDTESNNGGDAQTETFENFAQVTVNAEIELVPEEGEARLNDQQNEYIMGVAPILVDVKAPLLFSDLQLENDAILWDMDDDDQVEIENNANFIYPFGESKLHTINYRLPEHPYYSDKRFTFDVRVIESELAQCTLNAESLDGDKRWRFTPEFDELVDVAEYNYTIYDKRQDTFVERDETENDDTHTYRFEEGGEYEVQVTYFTPEGQKGSCAPKTIQVGILGNQVTFETKFRQRTEDPYLEAGPEKKVRVDHENNEINVNMLPAILQLNVTDISPDPNAELDLYYDGRQVFGEQNDRLFEVNIGTLGQKELRFEITSSTGEVEEQIYMVNVSRQPVEAKIITEPRVGESPLEVELDASVSSLYDEEDEIVYFTWDFGDGETQQNLSAGKVTHTYLYDTEEDTGEYYPRVTIKTKKGRTDTYKLEEPIVVKKQQKEVAINVESHPTRQAKVGDIVTFSIETDGNVDHIDWDFGEMGNVGCDGRSCATTPVRFDRPGDYTIRVEVQYVNDVPVTSRTTMRILE